MVGSLVRIVKNAFLTKNLTILNRSGSSLKTALPLHNPGSNQWVFLRSWLSPTKREKYRKKKFYLQNQTFKDTILVHGHSTNTHFL